MFFPFPTFVATTVWYGLREKIGSEFFVYRRKYGKLYDTCTYFDNSIKNLNCNENVDNESAVSGEVTGGPHLPPGCRRLHNYTFFINIYTFLFVVFVLGLSCNTPHINTGQKGLKPLLHMALNYFLNFAHMAVCAKSEESVS